MRMRNLFLFLVFVLLPIAVYAEGGVSCGNSTCSENQYCKQVSTLNSNSYECTDCSSLGEEFTLFDSRTDNTGPSGCYRECTPADIPHSTGVSGNVYYVSEGDPDTSTCTVTECEEGWAPYPEGSDTEAHSCACAAGYYIVTDSNCVKCSVGTFKETVGPDACTDCPTSATAPAGSTSADDCQCPANQYMNSDSTSCVACPANATATAGSTSADACHCNDGYHKETNSAAPPFLCVSNTLPCEDKLNNCPPTPHPQGTEGRINGDCTWNESTWNYGNCKCEYTVQDGTGTYIVEVGWEAGNGNDTQWSAWNNDPVSSVVSCNSSDGYCVKQRGSACEKAPKGWYATADQDTGCYPCEVGKTTLCVGAYNNTFCQYTDKTKFCDSYGCFNIPALPQDLDENTDLPQCSSQSSVLHNVPIPEQTISSR